MFGFGNGTYSKILFAASTLPCDGSWFVRGYTHCFKTMHPRRPSLFTFLLLLKHTATLSSGNLLLWSVAPRALTHQHLCRLTCQILSKTSLVKSQSSHTSPYNLDHAQTWLAFAPAAFLCGNQNHQNCCPVSSRQLRHINQDYRMATLRHSVTRRRFVPRWSAGVHNL